MATIEEVLGTDIAFKGDFVTSATGDIDKITGLENMKQALFHRLVTSPGTIIHRPNYGIGIKDYQNSPSTIAAQQKLALKIKDQFLQDPRVEDVTSVRVNFNAAKPEMTEIVVRVKLQGYDESAMAFVPFGEGV